MPPKGENENKRQPRKTDPESLWKDDKNASVVLMLVDSRSTIIQRILDMYSPSETVLSLVEFPGVLLPAFQPTLKALQSMKSAGNLPFANLLAPWSVEKSSSSDVPPPLYAMKPGFAFNLRCLMNNDADLYVRTGLPVDLQNLRKNSSLDDAQAAALVNCLQRKIGLIQGPPGTGKSYTGVALVKVLLANKNQGKTSLGPIVCVTYTNHALDQLLEALLDNKITSQIVRLGSQSKSDKLGPFNLHTIARNERKTKAEKSDSWQAHTELEQCEEDFFHLGLKKDIATSHLVSYIKEHHSHHHQQLFGTNKDGYQTVHNGKIQSIINHWLYGAKGGQASHRSVEELQQANVIDMSREERQLLHRYWVQELQSKTHREVIRLSASHTKTKSQLDNIRDEADLRCLTQADVVGMTTTGLAQRLNMLRKLRCKVVLCEEAGEVLESHLLTALLPSVEHAIFIGDHLQLRPQVQNYELSQENPRGGEQYSLDVSLFERLVDSDSKAMGCGLPFSTLETQRRMHPSMAQLVRDTLYPQLQDAPSVSEYPEVAGMRRRLFWLDHRMPEGESSNTDVMSTSHWNSHEIDMTTALVHHLVRQGKYQSGDIAVLTPYLGQLHRLRQRLSQSFAIALGDRDRDDLDKAGIEDDTNESHSVVKATLLQTLRVATVDNFQGEEAKVVVISLVRSNLQNRCGFLRTSNRINVLLSRAQHGMYIIGNSETSINVRMWADIIEILEQGNNIGEALELQCPRHPDTVITVSGPDDFPRLSPEGGCDLRCVNRLACGHACAQKCHSDVLHAAVVCLEPCPRPRNGCPHPCPKRCGAPCPTKCLVGIFQEDRVLDCGHLMQTLPCWQNQDVSTVRCPEPVTKVVPGCKHTVIVPCHVDVESVYYRCHAQCRNSLSCGHTCKRPCFTCVTRYNATDLQINHDICRQPCGRKHSTCAHTCTTVCHGENPCPPCSAPCDVQCGHSKCPRQCHEPCTPCAEERCLSACPHSACSMPCAAPCDHVPCSRRCDKMLECGHQCPSVCGEICPSSSYCQICGSEHVQHHEVDFILGQAYKDINLDENPCIFPKCGHFLTMESMDAQMDLKQYYVVDAEEKPIGLLASSQPFSMEDIRTCATCRGSFREIARYGRLVRRALLDESTKKFILYLNQEYVPLATELARHVQTLQEAEVNKRSQWPASIQIRGPRNGQVKIMKRIMTEAYPGRWDEMLRLRERVDRYRRRVEPEEQPFKKVRDMVENARRRNKTAGSFEIDSGVLQTKGALQATALSLRLDITLLADFLRLSRQTRPGEKEIKVDLQKIRDECQTIIHTAVKYNRLSQEAEGLIFLAQLYALELSHSSSPEVAESHLQQGRAAIDKSRSLCAAHPGQTQGLADEVDGAEQMLAGSTFYTAVTNEERMAVISAMAREFRGTGHWYYCRNGHPFTIGECGGAIQTASCPDCGAPVGGRDHQTAQGVTRADDLEQRLGETRL